MRFEHLVEINDLTQPEVRVLEREELWRGLVVRAEHPELFLPSLEGAPILTRTPDGLVRELTFGELRITDQVRFFASEVLYEIPPQGEIPRSSLRMSIEEPLPGQLFVRFVYEDERAPESEPEMAARRSAYEAADVDTVAIIRELAEAGELARRTAAS
ncbi:MAG: AtaL-like protein [Sandaracinus sp.]